MPTPRLDRVLTAILLLGLSISCSPRTPGNQPFVVATDSSTTPLSTLQPTQPPVTESSFNPTPAAKQTRAPKAPTSGQGGSDASQSLSFEVPSHPIDMILGRPTDNSITVSVLTYQDAEGYIEYGPWPDNYSKQTSASALSANQPVEFRIDGLQANSAYTYRVRYRSGSAGDYTAAEAGTFATQNAAGSPFTFTIWIYRYRHDQRIK